MISITLFNSGVISEYINYYGRKEFLCLEWKLKVNNGFSVNHLMSDKLFANALVTLLSFEKKKGLLY